MLCPLTSGLAHGAPFLQGLDSRAPVPWLTVLLSAACRDHVFLPSLSLCLWLGRRWGASRGSTLRHICLPKEAPDQSVQRFLWKDGQGPRLGLS